MAILDRINCYLACLSDSDTILALDLSKRRIGLATGALSHNVTTPRGIIIRKSLASDLKALEGQIVDLDAKALVIGLPLLASGEASTQTQSVHDMAKQLVGGFSMPAIMHDESFTSFEAGLIGQDRAVSRRSKGHASKLHPTKHLNDDIAATIILTDFIGHVNRHRARSRM